MEPSTHLPAPDHSPAAHLVAPQPPEQPPRASKHSGISSNTCQIRHQNLTNHPAMRQTCQSIPGTAHQCSARNLRPSSDRSQWAPDALVPERKAPDVPGHLSKGRRNLHVTPNGPYDPASSEIPRTSGLRGNTHLLDALELLLPLNGPALT